MEACDPDLCQQYCSCGGIVFDGAYIAEDSVDEQNEHVVSLVLSNFQSIFISKPDGITVKSLNNVDIVQSHTNVFDIYCHKCKCGFKLIIGRDTCYSCPLEECIQQSGKQRSTILKRSLSSFFPLLLRRFITEKRPNQSQRGISMAQSAYQPTFDMGKCLQEMDDDADYELMFSSKQECIVGSFKDQWILNPEISFT